jgi:hypothetical protein
MDTTTGAPRVHHIGFDFHKLFTNWQHSPGLLRKILLVMSMLSANIGDQIPETANFVRQPSGSGTIPITAGS